MAVGNERLRAARERTASLANPGECLSRQELAELANEHVWRHHGEAAAMDAGYLGKLERGAIRWPGRLYREALRAVLGAPTDAALGFANERRAVVTLSPTRRATALRAEALGPGGLALAPVLDLLEGHAPTPVPARVGASEVAQIHAAAHVFASWDHLYGGGLCREAVLAQLRWSARLLVQARYADRHRAPLLSAVGYLAHTFAFMAFDAYAHDDARQIFGFALGCAEEAADWHLRAKVLSSMARQAIWTGRADDGLTLIEYALVRADRLTGTERAMLHTAHARALAKMGRIADALAAVGRADDAFTAAQPAGDPPWMAYYDGAQHNGDTGHALFDLAVRGHPPRAAHERLAAAVAGHTDAYHRSRAISRIKLASLVMATGDPQHAAALGHRALDAAASIRSNRATDDLRELARYCGPHAAVSDVVDLRRRITTTVLQA